ncbi:hypothetical protein QPZ67_04405 [Bacillus stercoris]|nr:hypothetical protein [Bacillus stercoris]WIL36166.1 hypothetical protein QPZ67_04405 [Bacillus stercoris]
MNSFPTRHENSLLADAMLRYHEADLFLFIEDKKMPYIYEELIGRLVNLKIGKVYSLESKKCIKFV